MNSVYIKLNLNDFLVKYGEAYTNTIMMLHYILRQEFFTTDQSGNFTQINSNSDRLIQYLYSIDIRKSLEQIERQSIRKYLILI
jgi:hypothetical protein